MWTSLDTWMLVIAALAAGNLALLGNFLVLRRMSMMGDAISHAVLPGLAIAFLLTGTRAGPAMFIGAAIVGVLTAVLVELVTRFGKVDEGAGMGVVFTGLFAIGLVLIRQAADKVDLDANCVLFGNLANNAALYSDWLLDAGLRVPRSVLMLGAMLVVNGLFVGLLFKELRISSFDPQLATTLGVSANVMHYALMTLVAMTAVAAFEAVGSILVVALLVAPPVTAFLLCNRLGSMVIVSIILALVAAVAGHLLGETLPYATARLSLNTAGMTAVVTGVIFAIAILLEPRRGVIPTMLRQGRLGVRIAREDLLTNLLRQEEGAEMESSVPMGALTRRLALRGLFRRNQITRDSQLTAAGRSEANNLLRSHRLWERYMADHVGVRADHTHSSAERLEHVTDPAMRARLDAETVGSTDPHGKPIPDEAE